jgi:hypothetical protein
VKQSQGTDALRHTHPRRLGRGCRRGARPRPRGPALLVVIARSVVVLAPFIVVGSGIGRGPSARLLAGWTAAPSAAASVRGRLVLAGLRGSAARRRSAAGKQGARPGQARGTRLDMLQTLQSRHAPLLNTSTPYTQCIQEILSTRTSGTC